MSQPAKNSKFGKCTECGTVSLPVCVDSASERYKLAVSCMYGINGHRLDLDMAAKYAKLAAKAGHQYSHSLFGESMWYYEYKDRIRSIKIWENHRTEDPYAHLFWALYCTKPEENMNAVYHALYRVVDLLDEKDETNRVIYMIGYAFFELTMMKISNVSGIPGPESWTSSSLDTSSKAWELCSGQRVYLKHPKKMIEEFIRDSQNYYSLAQHFLSLAERKNNVFASLKLAQLAKINKQNESALYYFEKCTWSLLTPRISRL